MSVSVAAAVARSKQAALERAAQKEAEAIEAAALLERKKEQEAAEERKRKELRRLLVPGSEKKAYAELELCPTRLLSEVDDEGMTPLHRAGAAGLVSVVEGILRRKDLDRKKATGGDLQGRTPLHHAVLCNGREVKAVQAMLKHCSLEAKDCDGLTPLQTAQKWGLSEAAKVLHQAEDSKRKELEAKKIKPVEVVVEVKCNPKDISFMAGINAITEGRIEDARAITANMDWRFVNQVDSQGNTVLHLASLGGHDDLCRKLLAREDFKSFDAKNKEHATALHLAAGNKHIDCVRAIIESGRFAAVNARDMLDRTALHLAALRSDALAYEVISSHKECRPGIPDRYGKSASEYAVERGLDVELAVPDPDIKL